MGTIEKSDADGILPVVVGTALWAVALVVLVALRPRLEESGATWWIGAAAIGVVSGVLGLWFLSSRKRRQAQRP